ncbi:MAG: nucleotidyltransferase family protein [Hyphomicrobiaceae bacterium]
MTRRPTAKTAKRSAGARPTTAMVLGAGLGKRMRPLTDTMPKPLVSVAGRPLIDHVLDRLADAGITRTVVNVHYQADQLEGHLAGRKRPGIVISDERDRLLDTGGGVLKALPLLGSAPFVVHNSDSIWIEGIGSSLDRLMRVYDPERMDALLLLALGATSVGYDGFGDFLMDRNGLLQRRPERQLTPFVFMGVSILHPRALAGFAPGVFSLNAVWDAAIAKKRVYGVRHDGIWMHVGTPEAIGEAEAALTGQIL